MENENRPIDAKDIPWTVGSFETDPSDGKTYINAGDTIHSADLAFEETRDRSKA